MYTQFMRETLANIKFLGSRNANSENYVVAVPGRSTALSENKYKRFCLTHLAARALVASKEEAQKMLNEYLKYRKDDSLKVISESAYYEASFLRALTIIREFSDFALEEE